MLNRYTVSCTIETSHKFLDGKGIVTYDAMLVVNARDEEHLRQLIGAWKNKDSKIEIRTIQQTEITEDSESVTMSFDQIVKVHPAEKSGK